MPLRSSKRGPRPSPWPPPPDLPPKFSCLAGAARHMTRQARNGERLTSRQANPSKVRPLPQQLSFFRMGPVSLHSHGVRTSAPINNRQSPSKFSSTPRAPAPFGFSPQRTHSPRSWLEFDVGVRQEVLEPNPNDAAGLVRGGELVLGGTAVGSGGDRFELHRACLLRIMMRLFGFSLRARAGRRADFWSSFFGQLLLPKKSKERAKPVGERVG